ncbi:MAG TPA: bifunctional nuclease family protein [Propionibacterium sp.]|nr:bifunctional nuclease family protein [Propionibacterium sp.]
MIQVQVAMIAVDAEGSPVLLLKPVDASRQGVVLPIWIGPMETAAIMVASGLAEGPQRPLTYDLMVRLLEALDGVVQRVEVTHLLQGTFHAAITLETPTGTHLVDARPSDSIALALRVGAPMFVAEQVLAEAAMPDITQDEGETLAQFNEFLEQVDPEDFRNN